MSKNPDQPSNTASSSSDYNLETVSVSPNKSMGPLSLQKVVTIKSSGAKRKSISKAGTDNFL
jgi:hypothetical protein